MLDHSSNSSANTENKKKQDAFDVGEYYGQSTTVKKDSLGTKHRLLAHEKQGKAVPSFCS